MVITRSHDSPDAPDRTPEVARLQSENATKNMLLAFMVILAIIATIVAYAAADAQQRVQAPTRTSFAVERPVQAPVSLVGQQPDCRLTAPRQSHCIGPYHPQYVNYGQHQQQCYPYQPQCVPVYECGW